MSASTMVSVPENQQHLTAHWDSLNETQRDQLARQLQNVDFDLMAQLFAGEDKTIDWEDVAAKAEAPAAFRLDRSENKFSQEQAIEAGSQALSQGKVGVILVAGGQGSRLGFDHPKGMYPVGPVSERTLFQMHIEQLRAVSNKFGVSIPLYLMTSPATHAETIEFLEANDRFGLPKSDLKVFCQGTMPAVDAKTGELLLAAPDQLFLSPDGHGGTLTALDKEGCLADMESRGIEHVLSLIHI